MLHIQHSKGLTGNNVRKTGKSGTFVKNPTAAAVDVVRKVRNLIKLVNSPTERKWQLNLVFLCALSAEL